MKHNEENYKRKRNKYNEWILEMIKWNNHEKHCRNDRRMWKMKSKLVKELGNEWTKINKIKVSIEIINEMTKFRSDSNKKGSKRKTKR